MKRNFRVEIQCEMVDTRLLHENWLLKPILMYPAAESESEMKVVYEEPLFVDEH